MAADSRKKGRRGGGKRGWKIEEKEDLAFVAASLCPIHPYTLVPVIKQSGLINGDWLLDSIRVNPGADSALLLKFSNHSSWTEWNDSQTLCANTLTTPGLKLILFDVGREREREREGLLLSVFLLVRSRNQSLYRGKSWLDHTTIEQDFASRIISRIKKLDENWDWTGIEFNNLSIVHTFISVSFRVFEISNFPKRYDHSKVNERGDKLSEFVQILNQTNINRVYTILDDISINNSAIFFSLPSPNKLETFVSPRVSFRVSFASSRGKRQPS